MSEVVFAQLCKTVSSVDESKSKILDLYGTASSETPKDISANDFINLFYSGIESGDKKFNIDLDASSNELCKKFLDLSGSWYEKNDANLFQIAKRVPEEYGNMMGISVDCFDTCSLLKLRSELLELEDLCQVCSDRQVICCSLTLSELVEVLNDGDNTINRKNPSEVTLTSVAGASGGTFLSNASAVEMLKTGDKLAFSILITNPSNKVKDVEIMLHFNIKNN